MLRGGAEYQKQRVLDRAGTNWNKNFLISTDVGLRSIDDHGRYTAWKKADFPTDDTLRQCKVKRHEDLSGHIYLLFHILGIQFRWLLTRMGVGCTLVSSAECAVDDTKEHAWMTVYAHDRDVFEDLLYRRLKTL